MLGGSVLFLCQHWINNSVQQTKAEQKKFKLKTKKLIEDKTEILSSFKVLIDSHTFYMQNIKENERSILTRLSALESRAGRSCSASKAPRYDLAIKNLHSRVAALERRNQRKKENNENNKNSSLIKIIETTS